MVAAAPILTPAVLTHRHSAAPPPRSRRFFQRAFFCACGRPLQSRLAVCTSCLAARSYSRRCFGGHREAILDRDGHRCQTCAKEKCLNVHHRRPGVHAEEWLITLCAGCHTRVHRLRAVRYWLPEPILMLWEEQHPNVPRQLQFPLDERVAA